MTETLSFGYDGDRGLGDRLLAAVLRGEKTATSSLAVEYLSSEPLPRVGQRLTLVDHGGRTHGVVETTRVTVIPLHLVGDDVARDEGRDSPTRMSGGATTSPSGTRSSTWCAPMPATPTGNSVRPSPSSSTGSAWWR
ncbi:MAG: ASCH domain-containing protein [Nocardioidaceae bacterium]